jgi:hypothetical protein
MPMTLEMQQEAFSKAFAQAVCAVAGFASSQPDPDVDSVDWCVKGRIDGRTAQVDIQLKCLRDGAVESDGTHFSYELDNLKNYEDMIEPERLIPIILVVVRVPGELESWLAMDDQRLVLAHCAYWFSLRDLPPTTNKKSKSVRIPISQRFTPEVLGRMMMGVARRDLSLFEGQVRP